MSIITLYFEGRLNGLGPELIKHAIAGDAMSAKDLLEKDPSAVNFQDEATGLNALMIFAADGCFSMVDHIVGLPNADVTLEDVHGRTATLMAITIGRQDIADLISDRVSTNVSKLWPDIEAPNQATGNDRIQSASPTKVVDLSSRRGPPKPKL